MQTLCETFEAFSAFNMIRRSIDIDVNLHCTWCISWNLVLLQLIKQLSEKNTLPDWNLIAASIAAALITYCNFCTTSILKQLLKCIMHNSYNTKKLKAVVQRHKLSLLILKWYGSNSVSKAGRMLTDKIGGHLCLFNK